MSNKLFKDCFVETLLTASPIDVAINGDLVIPIDYHTSRSGGICLFGASTGSVRHGKRTEIVMK
jgi:hypothetical protein